MKIKEKERRRKVLEKSDPDQAGKHSRAAAAEKLKQLTKSGKASVLKVGPGTGSGWHTVGDWGDSRDTAHLWRPLGLTGITT